MRSRSRPRSTGSSRSRRTRRSATSTRARWSRGWTSAPRSDDGRGKGPPAKAESIKAAINWIKSIASDPEVGHIYEGTVVKVMDFGAFVNFFGSKDGLVHISQLAPHRANNT